MEAIGERMAGRGSSAQLVRIEVTEAGLAPARVQVAIGRPVRLVLTRTSDKTCATDVVLAELGLRADLPLGRPVELRFTPRRAGELRLACSMNMVSGVIDVR
jgi:plastocyanin domain-containing protein